MKLTIYDLDNTLFLWEFHDGAIPDGESAFVQQLKEILRAQRETGVVLAITSRSNNFLEICRTMGICGYFNSIITSTSISKLQMIREGLYTYPEISKNDVIFFDDDAIAAKKVQKLGVTSICVSQLRDILPYVANAARF